jgi:hypothetical protein
MAIDAASITQAQLAATKLEVTRAMHLPQHDGWQQRQQELEHLHLMVWDGKCSLLQ